MGIFEEASRYSEYLISEPELSCPVSSCANHNKGTKSYRHHYQFNGKTPIGSPQYICKLCGKTFVETLKTTARQRKPHLNRPIFKALVNKVPLRGICEIFDITMKTVYGKIDFLYEQCRKFVGARERKLLNGMRLPKLYISVDRQYYTVNWRIREDKRNVILYAIGSADNNSGYVFSIDLNYDPLLNQVEIEKSALDHNDYDNDPPFRQFTRLWLNRDFNREIVKGKSGKKSKTNQQQTYAKDLLDEKIIQSYMELKSRDNIESSDDITEFVQLPHSGMMVRTDYSLYGHFLHLKGLLSGAEKIRFFMDQETGIRAACLSTFYSEIKSRICDAFYVRINKEMTRDERERAQKEGNRLLKEYCVAHPGISKKKAKLRLLIERIEEMDEFGQWQDRWFTHPFPTLKEPMMKVCHLTDYGDYDIEHHAWLYNKASLHGINTFFANIRRKLSLLERPISTPSSLGRKWYGYSPYNPGLINKLLLIHRVYYNYVKKREQKITPAMKLGLARGPVDPNDIIYGRLLKEKASKPYFHPKYTKPLDFFKGPEPAFFDIDLGTKEITPLKKIKTTKQNEYKIEIIFLDTETTGVNLNDQIIEIAIVDSKGSALVNTLVNTDCPITSDAQKIHGISADMLVGCPCIEEIEGNIINAVQNKHVVIYNADFDLRFLSSKIRDAMGTVSCCMRRFAAFKEEIGHVHGTYRWFSLKEACARVEYKWSGKKHRAFADALACRAVWKFLES